MKLSESSPSLSCSNLSGVTKEALNLEGGGDATLVRWLFVCPASGKAGGCGANSTFDYR